VIIGIVHYHAGRVDQLLPGFESQRFGVGQDSVQVKDKSSGVQRRSSFRLFAGEFICGMKMNYTKG
jgi:hypothetical protein